jgi:hypothetical protein
MNLRVPWKSENFFKSSATFSFSRTLFYGVSYTLLRCTVKEFPDSTKTQTLRELYGIQYSTLRVAVSRASPEMFRLYCVYRSFSMHLECFKQNVKTRGSPLYLAISERVWSFAVSRVIHLIKLKEKHPPKQYNLSFCLPDKSFEQISDQNLIIPLLYYQRLFWAPKQPSGN